MSHEQETARDIFQETLQGMSEIIVAFRLDDEVVVHIAALFDELLQKHLERPSGERAHQRTALHPAMAALLARLEPHGPCISHPPGAAAGFRA